MIQTTETPETDIDIADVMSLLSDEYAAGILEALKESPSTAAELRERCEGSKVTIYRRLNSLEDAGLITSGVSVQADGNHCKVYYPVVDRVTITITNEGFDTKIDRR
ncbi:ArsR/SmtB family transcription factor [Halostagnicola bangensis]